MRWPTQSLLLSSLAAVISLSSCSRTGQPEVHVDGRPYSGVTLNVGIESAPVDIALRNRLPRIREELGVEIQIVPLEYGTLFEKILTDFITGTGSFDIVVYFARYNGDYMGAGFLRPLDEYVQEYPPDYLDILPAFRKLYSEWEGRIYALPYDGDYFLLYYRKDLFGHPEERSAFKRRYGYDLGPPNTWDEWLDIAEFFTRKPGETLAGEVLTDDFYGISEYWGRARAYAWFLNRFGSYSGLFFDENMEPRINSPGAVAALEHCVQSFRYNTPGPLGHTWWNVREDLLFGKVAMIFGWPDVGKAASEPTQSKVVGKVGFAPSPGVRDPDTGAIRRATALVSGRVMAVSQSCQNPEAAYRVIRLMSSRDVSMTSISEENSQCDPFRSSHLDHPELWKVRFDGLDEYLDASKAALDVGFPELTIPGAEEYHDALSRHVQEALQRSISPQQALDGVATEWRAITRRRGLEAQKRAWKSQLSAMQQLNLVPSD